MDSEKERVVASLRGLHARTQKNACVWETDDGDSFYTDLRGIRIMLRQQPGAQFDSIDYVVSFCSLDTGEVILDFTDVDLKDVMVHSYSIMRDLYKQARLTARGYKEALDSALDDLIKDDPDHIPF
ncbi:hypothetical protein KTD55_28160 [Burkholderia gladioli]|uniref:hypothetical protein n=1 Tax=Burkholderia gladioli TaxID=28095 RepID=UPI001C246D53|nr:hypothetical protein [Burkholderia gladioli]MBU9217945.1 hypothetical protein [Burkholderia gladioli]MDN7726961.1 hypothetical protein [Burkholderia gladioli]